MLKSKFLRALKDRRVFLVPGGYSPNGVSKVRVYIINELNEIERVNVDSEFLDNSKTGTYVLMHSKELSPVFILLAAICQKIGIDISEIDKLPPIL